MILRFHEDLRYLFPEEVEMEAATPLDALKMLAVQHPMNGKMTPVPVRIQQLQSLLEVNDPTITEPTRVFNIVPAAANTVQLGYMGSSSDNGWVNIAIGIVIIVIAVISQQYYLIGSALSAGGGAAMGTFAALAYQAAISIGVGLFLSGVMQLLSPTPKVEVTDQKASRVFGAKTTTEVGTPIQVIFGTYKVGFHMFSFNVESRNYDGVSDPENSVYFTSKVNENLPDQNLDRFYGVVQAGEKVFLNRTNNSTNRTGFEF